MDLNQWRTDGGGEVKPHHKTKFFFETKHFFRSIDLKIRFDRRTELVFEYINYIYFERFIRKNN